MEETKAVNRRTVLQRGIGFLAAIAGLEVLEARANAQAEPAVPKPPNTTSKSQVLRFHGRHWQTHAHGHAPGQLPGSHERMNRHGDLLDPITQKKAGDYYASCFCPAASFGATSSSGAGVELHTLRLGEDTLFGMGSAPALSGGTQLHAIVGGTGQFAGARGSFLVTQKPVSQVGSDVEIVLTIIT